VPLDYNTDPADPIRRVVTLRRSGPHSSKRSRTWAISTRRCNAPGWQSNTQPVAPKLAAALKLPVTWQMSFLYAVTFGGFFVSMAFALGLGTGGVFAWVALRSPTERVGSVTGIVGAAGGVWADTSRRWSWA